MLLNVLDFAKVSDAFNAATDGDRIYFPGNGPYQVPSGDNWIIRRSVEVFGDGKGTSRASMGSILLPAHGSDTDVLILDPQPGVDLESIYIHDLRIAGSQAGSNDGGDGIRLGLRGTDLTSKKLVQPRFERLAITNMGGVGIRLQGVSSDTGAVVNPYLSDISVESCSGAGMSLAFAFVGIIVRCRFVGNGAEGLRAVQNGSLNLQSCVFDSNRQVAGASTSELWIELSLPRINACEFRNLIRATSPTEIGAVAVRLRSNSSCTYISGCVFDAQPQPGGFDLPPANYATGMLIEGISTVNLQSGPHFITGNRFTNITTSIATTDTFVSDGLNSGYPDINLAGCTAWSQYSDRSSALQLPGVSTDQPFGVVTESINAGVTARQSGFIMPALEGPPADPQSGCLAYFDGALHVFANGAWKTVVLL